MRDKVVMIRKHSPRFAFPAEFVCDDEKAALQNVETLNGSEMMSFTVSAGRDEVSSGSRTVIA